MIKSKFFTAKEIQNGEMQNWLELWKDGEYTLHSANTVRSADGNDILVVIMVPA